MPNDDPFKQQSYNPLDAGSSQVIKCPKCGEADFDAHSNQYGIHRKCRRCKNEWSGGGVGFFPPGTPHRPDEPAPDDDVPFTQFTGAPYRRFGGED